MDKGAKAEIENTVLSSLSDYKTALKMEHIVERAAGQIANAKDEHVFKFLSKHTAIKKGMSLQEIQDYLNKHNYMLVQEVDRAELFSKAVYTYKLVKIIDQTQLSINTSLKVGE